MNSCTPSIPCFKYYQVPPSPELEKKILASKQRFLKGESLPGNITMDLLDLQSLILITRRPAFSRAHTLADQPPSVAPVVGERRALVLLVDFEDNIARTPRSHYETMLFSSGMYSTGSLRDYYWETSYRRLNVTGDVSGGNNGWYRAPNSYSYYTNKGYGFGIYPKNATKLVEDIVDLASNYVNFAQYDNDRDGEVDALFIVHAGPGAEITGNLDNIWSHMSFIPQKVVNGVRIGRYSMEPEDGNVGVFCHELGHVFGLPDLYDYDLDSAGTGKWDLMASGSWNNDGRTPAHPVGWCKARLGWATPETVNRSLGRINLKPSSVYPEIYKLPIDGNSKEYFLIENRKRIGFDSYIPGDGLMVLHVDESRSDNNDQSHYLVDIEQCDGRSDLNRNINRGDEGDLFPSRSNKAFAFDTNPNSKKYDGADSKVALKNIQLSADVITAEVVANVPSTNAYSNPKTSSEMSRHTFDRLPDRFLYHRFV